MMWTNLVMYNLFIYFLYTLEYQVRCTMTSIFVAIHAIKTHLETLFNACRPGYIFFVQREL